MIGSQELSSNLKATQDTLAPIHRDMDRDFKFYALDQWPEDIKERLTKLRKPALVFDMIRAAIHTVTGAEMTNRYQSKFQGFQQDTDEIDSLAAELFNYLYSWSRSKAQTEHEESLAFSDCVVCGYGATDTYVEHDRYVDGLIITKRLPPWNIGWDGTSIEPNMADTTFRFYHKTLSFKTFEAIYGKEGMEAKDSAISNISPGGISKGLRVPGRQYEAGGESTNINFLFGVDEKAGLVRVIEYQYYVQVLKHRVTSIDPQSGQRLVELVVPKDFDAHMKAIERGISEYNQHKQDSDPEAPRPEVRRGIIDKEYFRLSSVGSQIIGDKDGIEPIPYKDFTIKIMTGEEDWSHYQESGDGYKSYYGLVRPARDPQQWRNRFMSMSIHLFGTNPKGTLLYERDLFDDPEEAMDRWSMADGSIEVGEGKLSGTKRDKFMQLQSGNAALRDSEALMGLASSALGDAMGVNAQYAGGQAQDLRRTAYSSIADVAARNLDSLSAYFDSLKRYRKGDAELKIAMYREDFSRETLLRIAGKKFAEVIDLVADLDIQDYDVVVSEKPATERPSADVSTALIQNLPSLAQAGMPIPPSVLPYLIPEMPQVEMVEWQKMWAAAMGLMGQEPAAEKEPAASS